MLEGLTDDNKDYRDKFVNTFKKDIYNLDFWSKDIMEIDRLLDIEQKLTFDFNVNDTMNLSPQEAQQELNLVEQEINQLSAPTQSYDQLLEQLNFS